MISRFNVVTTADLMLPSRDDRARPSARRTQPARTAAPSRTAPDATLSLVVQANPRQTSRGRGTAERTTAILQFYASLIGDVPYPSFTLALTESDLPGGHSPAYFAMLNQPLPTTPFVWRNDPVSFSGYPSFFLAHELAHQWWGQAVGWKNYHEQWLSEGFAQYFAAMYAEKERGADTFEDVLRQMRRWAIETSPQGPVYLGYRLGHIKSDSRVFRAVVYNKAAMVLHMLRRWSATRRSSAACAVLRGVAVQEGGHRRLPGGDGEGQRAGPERVLRGVDLPAPTIPRLQVRHTRPGIDRDASRIEQRGEVIPVPVTHHAGLRRRQHRAS